LQPLDLTVNKATKQFSCKVFLKWYALQVRAQLEGKVAADLRISVMKPLGAKCLFLDLYNYLKGKPKLDSMKLDCWSVYPSAKICIAL